MHSMQFGIKYQSGFILSNRNRFQLTLKISYNFNEEANETKRASESLFLKVIQWLRFEILMIKRIGEQTTSLVKRISYKLRISTKYTFFKKEIKKYHIHFLPTYLTLLQEVFVIMRS